MTHFRFTGNTVLDNGDRAFGILAELSAHGIIADNKVSGSQSGVTVMDTGDVKIYNNTLRGNTLWDIGGYQDDRYLPGRSNQPSWIVPTPDNPWLVEQIDASNNDMSGATGQYQYHVQDHYTNRSADVMQLTVNGNLFRTDVTTNDPRMIGWGNSDNSTVTTYRSVAAFQQAKNPSWHNAETTTGPASAYDSYAVGLPADVADLIGQASGSKRIGTYW